jgi:hypothetical protein
MSLPTSGSISMDMIRAELGVPSQSPFSLNTARSGGYVTLNTNSPTLPPATGQVSLASWYGYCQTCKAYYFSYQSTSVLACLNNDPITILSNTIPIGVGSIITDANGAQAPYPYFYSDGTNWYYVESNAFEQTIVVSTAACGSVNTAVVFMNSFVDYPYGYADSATACALGGVTGVTSSVYYTGTLGNGTILYFDAALTNVFDADGSFGWYWISGYSFQYVGGVITNYGACPTATLFYISNSSLDISISDVQVNGISVYGATGAGFPVNSGDSINAYSNELGTQNVVIYYSNSIYGQNIQGYDSNLTFYCNDVVTTGGNNALWASAYVGSGTFQIYAYDGSC